jgi:hypothetical protein
MNLKHDNPTEYDTSQLVKLLRENITMNAESDPIYL